MTFSGELEASVDKRGCFGDSGLSEQDWKRDVPAEEVARRGVDCDEEDARGAGGDAEVGMSASDRARMRASMSPPGTSTSRSLSSSESEEKMASDELRGSSGNGLVTKSSGKTRCAHTP